MVSIIYSGRLGNNLFQYVAAYIFAKKFNFNLITPPPENCFDLPKTKTNPKLYDKIIDVTDNNFISLLDSDILEPSHYRFIGYYQQSNFILNNINQIKSLFLLNIKNNINDVFVAYRIGDINGDRQMLPIEYYYDALTKLNTKTGYITSDSPTHPNVLKLINDFNLKLFDDTPLNTIDFGKNFNKLVLSEGSFSWWIGFLSNAKDIYYNERDRFWHGDMFVIPEWKSLKYDWSPNCISTNNKLICNQIINNN